MLKTTFTFILFLQFQIVHLQNFKDFDASPFGYINNMVSSNPYSLVPETIFTHSKGRTLYIEKLS